MLGVSSFIHLFFVFINYSRNEITYLADFLAFLIIHSMRRFQEIQCIFFNWCKLFRKTFCQAASYLALELETHINNQWFKSKQTTTRKKNNVFISVANTGTLIKVEKRPKDQTLAFWFLDIPPGSLRVDSKYCPPFC